MAGAAFIILSACASTPCLVRRASWQRGAEERWCWLLLAVVVVIVVICVIVAVCGCAVRCRGAQRGRGSAGQAEGWRGCAGAGDALHGLRTRLGEARAQGQVW